MCWCSGLPSCDVCVGRSGVGVPSAGAGAETDFDGLMLKSSDGTGLSVDLSGAQFCAWCGPPAVIPCAVSGRLPACSLRLCLRVRPALHRAAVLGGDGLLLYDVHLLLQRFLFRLRRVASVLCGRHSALRRVLTLRPL